MKKHLALALALVMTLALASPAWAAESPGEVTPEQAAEIAEKYGLEAPEDKAERPDGDFGYSVKAPEPLPENWWMDDVVPGEDDYVYIDPDSLEPVWTNPAYDGTYEEYEAAHPEEFENLDPEQLLAGWGYVERTPAEWFLAYEGEYGETLEEAVWRTYVSKRIKVEYNCAQAEEYRAKYPKEWAKFDADSYFESVWLGYSDSLPDKAAYMARYNVLTEDEFVDDMFVTYVDDNRYTAGFEQDEYKMPEPTLTLTVNGVATDVELTAGEGVTYADAAALRQFFGPEAVPADKEGLLPVRATAQAAGWDVGWYSSRWSGEREVQLWDKASYGAYLADEFGPLNDFFAKALKASGNTLFAETPVTTHQTVTADLTRFSTLDGDETFRLTFDVDYVMGGGVLDVTVTFDVTELLKLFPADALESLTKMGGFSVTQLRQFLKAGVMEFIIDYNTGEMAYNVPLLALADESLAGWQTEYISGLDGVAEAMDGLEEFSLTSTLYAQMTTVASYAGAEYALDEYEQTVGLLAAFAGKDRFATRGGKTTYSISAQAMNEAVSALINADADESDSADTIKRPVYSIFKAFDITYTLDEVGNVTAKLHIRPDTDGIATAIAKAYESSYYGDSSAAGAMEIVMNLALKGWNVDITASSQGNAARSTGSVDIHWNNVGKLTVRTTATQTGGKTPRSIDDIVK